MKMSPPPPSPSSATALLSGLLSALLSVAVLGCVDEAADPPTRSIDAGAVDADLTADAEEGDAGTDDAGADEPPPQVWAVYVDPEAPRAVRLAADDVVATLTQMGVACSRRDATEPVPCLRGEGRVVFLGERAGEPDLRQPDEVRNDQTWRVASSRCRGGRRVTLAGGGLLGRQYAAYAWLHALGVRFFHPEQTFVPTQPTWTSATFTREHTPAFQYRSVSLHLTHPLELGDPLRLGDTRYTDEVTRYIDWGVRNFASQGLAGMAGAEHPEHGVDRGFPREAGFSLHNQQQGASGIIDPDDPRTDEAQIAAAIDARMGNDPSRYPTLFGFTFNPSEFTELDDRMIVRQLTFIAEYFAEKYPGTIPHTVNHGTAGEPTSHYGVRFYDLPQFAPENLGVRVHTLMFYDLQRPAPVYGNDNFHYLYEFMVQEYRKRPLWYFPEAAWWLTFDIAVPLYLPITIEARSRDLQLIRFMLDGKLIGHRVFGSGHEWGYWQNEYCSYRMAADLDYDWRACLADLTSPMGAAAGTVQRVLEDLVALQERDFIYGDILGYLVGTDPETEAAAEVGIVFHPLPPRPDEIDDWSAAEIDDWRRRIAPALARMDTDHERLGERLSAAAGEVPAPGLPYFTEVRDGVEANRLRAAHALALYGALVTLREARLTGDETLEAEARDLLQRAEGLVEEAQAVIARREEGYRYRPLERSIGGGATLDQDANWTTYPYRYLARTHHAYYYRFVTERAAAAFESAEWSVDDAVVGLGEPITVRVGAAEPRVDFGDGTVGTEAVTHHTYAEAGVYAVRIEGAGLAVEGNLAALEPLWASRGNPRVVEPAGAALIAGALPAVRLGGAGAGALGLGFTRRAGGAVEPRDVSRLLLAPPEDVPEGVDPAAGGFATLVSEMTVPIFALGDARPTLSVTGAVLSRANAEAPLRITGALSVDDLVAALVSTNAFDEEGARGAVAGILGLTPETLPDALPLAVDYPLE